MDVGSKLGELNLTSEELNRFSNAFKDEKFRDMLREYAEEISDPENKKKYEDDITLMEQERGMDIKFIHPKPELVLKTSLEGKQKCFINVCSNELIGKPECRADRVDGRAGQHWSLPYSVTPGRPDVDSKGKKIHIYDVVFHPDTLYIAGKNYKFMKLVETTAVQGVQHQCKVKLDQKNVRVLKIKYKGTPTPAVIRKPVRGHAANETEAEPNDPLRFPYPYDETRSQSTEGPSGGQNQPGATQAHSDDTTTRPTEPRYTVKYRSYVDLQDYRCSRDSAPGPRPKEIVITVDLPLLKSAENAALNVTEKFMVLESLDPFYRLVLPLAYPVDDKKGSARFNKFQKQLTVTLPVLPVKSSPMTETDPQQLVSDTTETRNNDDDMVTQSGEVGVVGAPVSGFSDQPHHHQPSGSEAASHPAEIAQSVDPVDNQPEASLENHDGFEPTEVPYVESEGPVGDPGRLTDASKPTDPRLKDSAAAAACEENLNEEEEAGVPHRSPDNAADEKSKATSNLGCEARAGTGDKGPRPEPEPAPRSPPEDEVSANHGDITQKQPDPATGGRDLDGAVGFSAVAKEGEDGETREWCGSVGEAEMREQSGSVGEAEMREWSGSVREAEMGECTGSVREAETRECSGSVREAETRERSGSVGEAEMRERSGSVGEAEMRECSGSVREQEMGERSGSVREAEMEECSGSVRDAEMGECSGSVREAEMGERSGSVREAEMGECSGSVREAEMGECSGSVREAEMEECSGSVREAEMRERSGSVGETAMREQSGSVGEAEMEDCSGSVGEAEMRERSGSVGEDGEMREQSGSVGEAEMRELSGSVGEAETSECGGSVGEAETGSTELDEDDLPADGTPLPVVLREVSGESVRAESVSDHSTSAAFSFQNSLLYELD